MKEEISKELQELFDQLLEGAYIHEFHAYNYKYTNQIIRKFFENLEHKNKELIEDKKTTILNYLNWIESLSQFERSYYYRAKRKGIEKYFNNLNKP